MSVLPCPHRRPRSPAEEQVTVPKLHAPNLGVRRWADTSLHGARHTPGPGGQQGCRAGGVRPRLALAGAPGPGRSRPRFGEEGWGANPGPWCSWEEAVVCNGRLLHKADARLAPHHGPCVPNWPYWDTEPHYKDSPR